MTSYWWLDSDKPDGVLGRDFNTRILGIPKYYKSVGYKKVDWCLLYMKEVEKNLRGLREAFENGSELS